MSNLPNNQTPKQFARGIVGREIFVTVHQRAADGRRFRDSCYYLFRPVIDDVLDKAGIRGGEMQSVCEAAVLACVGKLMLASGFTVEYGDSLQPDEVVTIKLRDDEPVYRDAVVQRKVFEATAPNTGETI